MEPLLGWFRGWVSVLLAWWFAAVEVSVLLTAAWKLRFALRRRPPMQLAERAQWLERMCWWGVRRELELLPPQWLG